MWGQITCKSHVPNLNVGRVFDTEMAAAAPMSFPPQLPSIQNFLVVVKVMTTGVGGGGGVGETRNLHMGIPALDEEILIQQHCP